jgi:hypothetical protein
MAYLKLVDDDGTESQFALEHISVQNLVDGDSIIATVEIGTLSPSEARLHMERVNALLKTLVPEGIKVACLASRLGKKDIEFETLHKDTSQLELEV